MYSLSDIESYYYAVNFSSSDKYYVLKVGNSCDDFNDFIDHNSTYSSQQNINNFTYDFYHHRLLLIYRKIFYCKSC